MIVFNVLISQEVLSRRANSVYIGLTQRCVLARFDGEERNVPNVELASGAGGGGTICGCTLHVDYSNVTLTNLASGHVYRLDPISADSP